MSTKGGKRKLNSCQGRQGQEDSGKQVRQVCTEFTPQAAASRTGFSKANLYYVIKPSQEGDSERRNLWQQWSPEVKHVCSVTGL